MIKIKEKTRRIITFIILFSVIASLYSCCIFKKGTTTKEEFKVKKDTIRITTIVKSDTSKFLSSIDSLILLAVQLDSINKILKEDSSSSQLSLFSVRDSLLNKVKELESSKKRIVKVLEEGKYKKTVIASQDTFKLVGDSNIYIIPFQVNIEFDKGAITYNVVPLIDKLDIVKKVIPNRGERQLSFFKWLKDTRSLVLIIFLLMLITFIAIRR